MAWPSLNPTKPRLLITSLLLLLLLFLLHPSVSEAKAAAKKAALRYHKGPILKGQIKLGILWYGRFGAKQKAALRNFIHSLNDQNKAIPEPSVSTWWRRVELYQSAASSRRRSKKSPRIQVRLVRQKTDKQYSVGKILTQDFFPPLLEKATGGDPSTIAVIVAARDVSIDGTCLGQCSRHGALDAKHHRGLYIVLGNPETECPSECAFPFHNSKSGHKTLSLEPPNGDIGADAMVISFASALANTVTNPFGTGFYNGADRDMVEAASVCQGIFGSGAFDGYAGKVHMAPGSGGCFNAHGSYGKKFLLPAIWSPKSHTCRTLM